VEKNTENEKAFSSGRLKTSTQSDHIERFLMGQVRDLEWATFAPLAGRDRWTSKQPWQQL
jgi:hypothetical protein